MKLRDPLGRVSWDYGSKESIFNEKESLYTLKYERQFDNRGGFGHWDCNFYCTSFYLISTKNFVTDYSQIRSRHSQG